MVGTWENHPEVLSQSPKRLAYVGEDEWQALDAQLERIDQMLSGLIRRRNRQDGRR